MTQMCSLALLQKFNEVGAFIVAAAVSLLLYIPYVHTLRLPSSLD